MGKDHLNFVRLVRFVGPYSDWLQRETVVVTPAEPHFANLQNHPTLLEIAEGAPEQSEQQMKEGLEAERNYAPGAFASVDQQ